jgi:hypothetical protein
MAEIVAINFLFLIGTANKLELGKMPGIGNFI